MKKYLLLLALLMLVACGSSKPPTTTTSENEETAVPADQATAVPDEPTEVPQAPESEPADVVDTDAYAFATTVEDAAIVRAEDHYLGTDDPAVTIIEYGDFQ